MVIILHFVSVSLPLSPQTHRCTHARTHAHTIFKNKKTTLRRKIEQCCFLAGVIP